MEVMRKGLKTLQTTSWHFHLVVQYTSRYFKFQQLEKLNPIFFKYFL